MLDRSVQQGKLCHACKAQHGRTIQHCHQHGKSCAHCSDQGAGAQSLIKGIAQSADAGPGGWVGLKRKLLHLDVDGSGAVNAEGKPPCRHVSGLAAHAGVVAWIVVKTKNAP